MNSIERKRDDKTSSDTACTHALDFSTPSNVVKLPQDSILTAQHRGQVYLRRVFPDKVLLIYSECKNGKDRGCNSGDGSRPRPADVALSP